MYEWGKVNEDCINTRVRKALLTRHQCYSAGRREKLCSFGINSVIIANCPWTNNKCRPRQLWQMPWKQQYSSLMNRLQLGPISSSPLCIEKMSWGRTLVMCRACFGPGDFLRCGRGLGGSLGGDIIWVVCVRCGRGFRGGLGGI